MKPGDQLFRIIPNEDGTLELDTYQVRTVRGGRVYAILRCCLTWGKRSKRNGDWGWLPNIPSYCRESWPVGHLPDGFGRSKISAWRQVAKMSDKKLGWYVDDPALYSKIRSTAKRQVTRLKK